MADDAYEGMADARPKRAQGEEIPPADPNYPPYELKFAPGSGVARLQGIFGQGIPGSHTLVVSAGNRRIRISYEHNDPDDLKPMLNVLIEDLGDGPNPSPRQPGPKKRPAKKAANSREDREESRQEDGEGASQEGGQEGCEESRQQAPPIGRAAGQRRPPTPATARGLRLCGEGRLAAGVRPLEAAVRLDPREPRFARDLGAVYGALRRWSDAFRVLAPCVHQLDPAVQAVFLMAGRELREPEAALAVLEAGARPGAGSDPVLLCEYGHALFAAEREAEAEAVLLACLESPAKPARVHDALAAVYNDGGYGDLGLAHGAEYARACPASAPAQLRLASLLALRGRLAESRTARLRAIGLGLFDPVDWTTALQLMLNDTHEDGVSIRRACRAAFDPDGPVRRRHSAAGAAEPIGAPADWLSLVGVRRPLRAPTS